MRQHISKSVLLLFFCVVICCVIYPAVLWVIGQTVFPFGANGSMVNGPDGKPVGSLLIAQPFTKDEYFQPRPSAASYDPRRRPRRPWRHRITRCATGSPPRSGQS